MVRVSIVTAFLCLTACQQSGDSGNAAAADANSQNSASGAPAAAASQINAAASTQAPAQAEPSPVPADFDWHFVTHGGSGNLDFGDGEWAEGERLLSFSCLPASGKAEISLDDGRPATLSAGQQTATLQPDQSVAANHPLLQALRASGTMRLSTGGSERTLTAKRAGREQIEAFFAYCTTGAGRNPG